MMIRDIQKAIENLIRPSIGGMFTTGRTKTAFTGMRDQLDVSATLALVNMTSQNSGATSQYLTNALKNNRSYPPVVFDYKINPVGGEDGGYMITNMVTGMQHDWFYGF